MEIGGLQKTTLIDYPGHVACTVFLIGCNFRCPWCYSSEIVLPEKINYQPRIQEKEFFDFLETRKESLDGVVVCGGEPTINNDLPQFLGKIKEKKLKIKLDTNGSNPQLIKQLLEKKLVDYIAMDIKASLNKEQYQKATGVNINIDDIKNSINIIKNSGIDYEFRTTVVPGIHDEKEIIAIAQSIKNCKKYFLQKFKLSKNIDPLFVKQDYSVEFLQKLKEKIEHLFDVCEIRY